uniref:Glycoside hydrolase family protein n=1 Tax=Podoviridae sp. ctefc32 TaxID=2827742 RepID=A0A8S5T318_9CAUD|nr:MAG TPA: glycoside hydrolase family protein [Podoviridae sp. ctefc32]
MSNSNLVTRWWPANPTNYTNGREGNKIQGIVVHHE